MVHSPVSHPVEGPRGAPGWCPVWWAAPAIYAAPVPVVRQKQEGAA